MNRVLFLALVASAALAGTMSALLGQADPPVNLQAATPGVQQVGNTNISGKAIAGSISASNSSPTAQVIVGNATSTTGANYGGLFRTDSTTGTGLRGVAGATTGSANGGTFQSGSPNGGGVRGYATSPTGTNYGMYGKAVSPNGFGVFSDGNMSASGIISGNGSGLTNLNAFNITSGLLQPGRFPIPFQLYGWSSTGIIIGTNTANGYEASGVHGVNASLNGHTYGVHGEVSSTSGRAVFGHAFASTGSTHGGEFWSNSTSGRGVSGFALANTGVNFGGQFYSQSTSGRGVYAEALTETDLTTYGGWFETASTVGRGVYGLASAAGATDTPYGVRGLANPATLGYGVFAVGDSGSSGTKSFRIDHPFDPENKYLVHYSNESPTPQNQYFGTITTDATGYAWVQLPAYFEAINKEIKYQLTVIDDSADFVFAKVTKKVQGNRFQVRTSKPSIEVSWMVVATRNDLYCRTKKPTDVREKAGLEKGQYQHPELYNLGPERGMDYDPERAKQRKAPPVTATASRAKVR